MTVVVVVYSTLKARSDNRFKFNVLFRVLVSHIQMMAITVTLDFSWPDALDKALGGFLPIANLGTRFISLDCFIDARKADGTGENPLPLLFVRAIVFATLPAVVLGLVWGFWTARFSWVIRKHNVTIKEDAADVVEEGRIKSSRITSTSIVVMFLIYPSIIKGLSDLFLCDDVAGKTRLVKALDTECYTGKHWVFIGV